jgi:hypothetical protein
MMNEVIERFRYRLQLWWRDQREDLSWLPGPHQAGLHDSSKGNDPKYEVVIAESTPRFIIRGVGVYFGVIIIFSGIGRLIDTFVPAARFVVFVAFVAFVCLWTLMMIGGTVDLVRARKARRTNDSKSSNQSLQLTADRPDDPVSIHEPPYTPSFPRFRQR